MKHIMLRYCIFSLNLSFWVYAERMIGGVHYDEWSIHKNAFERVANIMTSTMLEVISVITHSLRCSATGHLVIISRLVTFYLCSSSSSRYVCNGKEQKIE